MATTLSHHQLQHQQLSHQIQQQQQQQQQQTLQQQLPSSGHFCKDCGVMFESSTSLEVHLSYHKENLLTRWATQESMDKSHSHTHPPAPSPHNQRAPADIPTSNSSSSSHNSRASESDSTPQPQYFTHVENHVHYVSSQYNNNTGDHHIEPSYRPGAGNFGQPPVETHGHLYGSHNSLHHSVYPPPPPGSLNPSQLFSPNSTSNNSTNDQRPPPSNPNGASEQPTSREAAEILDLDSHKVHIYQQQQQQQLAAERANPSFHRPYLPHLLPPSTSNGWPPGPTEHQFVNNHTHSPAGFEHQSLPAGVYSPLQNNNGPSTNSVYDIMRSDIPNSGYPSEPSGPMGYPPPQQPNHHLQQNTIQPSFGAAMPGAFPPVPQQIIKSESLSVRSPGAPPSQRSPPEGGRGSKSHPSTAVKTKGWKGGECKRPKTYNCSACNKWFTSSGHLKRHYGTTLHKNSVKQKGEMPEETPAGTKGGKRSPGDSQRAGGSDSMEAEPSSSSSPSRINIKLEDSNSGKSTPIYGAPPSSTTNNSTTNSSLSRAGDINLNNPNFNHNLSSNPPVPVPSPNSPYNIPGGPAYLSYGTQNAGPNSNPNNNNTHHIQTQQYISNQQFLSMSHPPVPFSNGFAPETIPMPSGAGHYSVPSPIVPTTIYSSGGSYLNVNGENTPLPLPPFSTVGFSHYDPSTFQLISSSPNPNSNAFPPNPSPTRVTPPYQQHQHLQQQHQQSGQIPSPPNNNNNNGNHLETSFESERDNRGNSPEESRSGSLSGSVEGSLDGLEQSGSEGGSPTSSNSDSNKEGGEMEGELLKCPDCSKTFGRACYLTQHANSAHSGGKPLKCPTCGKRFPEEPALADHVAKHGSEKPYKCDLCPKQFNHKTDLRRHLCLHTGEKPFVCTHCGKGFIRKDHMTKHCETHRKKGSGT